VADGRGAGGVAWALKRVFVLRERERGGGWGREGERGEKRKGFELASREQEKSFLGTIKREQERARDTR